MADGDSAWVVGQNPSAPPEALTKVVQNVEPWARMLVAENLACPLPLLVQMVREDDVQVRCAAATVERIPVDVLDELADSPSRSVQMAVAGNPSAGEASLRRLAERAMPQSMDPILVRLGGNPSAPPDILRALADSDRRTTRSAVASNPSTPTDVLADLYSHDDEGIRAKVATNPNSPDWIRFAIALT